MNPIAREGTYTSAVKRAPLGVSRHQHPFILGQRRLKPVPGQRGAKRVVEHEGGQELEGRPPHERGGRGARIAQFIFDKDMRSAGVEPDIRHANVLLAADSFLLSGHVGEKTLLAIADGAFGPLCRPNADSHAIVMEAHLEAIESAARKAAHRLSGPNKELTRRREERRREGRRGVGGGGERSSGGGAARAASGSPR